MPGMTAPFGLFVVDKPSGPTSHDVVDALRRVTRERRIGHTGTLDPMASGVLVLCFGVATRLAEHLLADEKRYLATVRFGTTTDTYDRTGRIVATAPVAFSREDLERALAAFRGRIEQRPPSFSAVRIDGERAFKKAYRGDAVETRPRTVDVRELALIDFAPPLAVLDVRCSSGTYIRSLAHDLGARLGCGASLDELRRTECGTFRLADAVALEQLLVADSRAEVLAHLRNVTDGLPGWPAVELSPEQEDWVRNGGVLPFDPAPPETLFRLQSRDGTLVAVGHYRADRRGLQPRKVL